MQDTCYRGATECNMIKLDKNYPKHRLIRPFLPKTQGSAHSPPSPNMPVQTLHNFTAIASMLKFISDLNIVFCSSYFLYRNAVAH